MKNQILHIFRKDVHHHWPAIVLSLLAATAYTWRESTRMNAFNSFPSLYDIFLSWLPPLVVVSWAFLIVRVVHGENLVGDRQFWVTRPYEWKKLLVAKLLFILVFVNIPLFCVQIFLLMKAGFAPSTHLAGLFWLQLLWAALVFLPLMVLATVTATTGQLAMAVLGVFLYYLFFGEILSRLPGSQVSGVSTLPSALAFLAVMGASLAVVLWQYSRRIAAACRVLLLGAVLIVPIIFAVMPYRTLIAHIYPALPAGQQPPVTLAFDATVPPSHGRGFPEKNKVHVNIPLLVSGIAEDTEVVVGGRMVSVQASGGKRWSSGWQASYEFFLPDLHHDQTTLTIDQDYFERVKSSPASVHITYAFAPRRAQQTTRVVVRGAGFAVPDEGRCSFSSFDPKDISCLFPLKTPSQLVSAKAEEITCPPREHETPLPAGTTLYGGVGGYGGTGPADFGINPITITLLGFRTGVDTNNPNDRPHVCPGTPLSFYTNWEELPTVRSDLDINDIRLVDYQLKDSSDDSFGFGIRIP